MVAYSNLSNKEEDRTLVTDRLDVIAETQSHLIPSSINHIAANNPSQKSFKQAIRTSLKASTWDGVFAAIFSSITSGVLLSNFLLNLGATPVEIGMLSSIPMLVNFLQPLGAYLSDRTSSRHWYCFFIFAPSRLLWLLLVAGIICTNWFQFESHQLVSWTLIMVLLTNVLGSLGGASWLSWMAALVPHRLRGRYFGLRNSAASFTSLLSVPLMGLVVSIWPSGSIHGYGFILFLAVVAGIISLLFQWFMVDVNPQEQGKEPEKEPGHPETAIITPASNTAANIPLSSLFSEASPNYWKFLFYFGLWAFAVNVSAPFFNLYMLDNLKINISLVTIYNSLGTGANLMLLILWGKLADRIGNRPLLLLVGIVGAIMPLFWLGAGNNFLSIWLVLPLLHLVNGGAWAAIDLCGNNLQMAVAPKHNQATYFAIAAAVAGVGGAIGTTVGGYLSGLTSCGGLPGMFALSAVLRLITLLPLLFVHEHGSTPVRQLIQNLLPTKPELVPIPLVELVNRSK